MSKYVWQHDLKGESDRLRLMSIYSTHRASFITTDRRCDRLALLGDWRG